MANDYNGTHLDPLNVELLRKTLPPLKADVGGNSAQRAALAARVNAEWSDEWLPDLAGKWREIDEIPADRITPKIRKEHRHDLLKQTVDFHREQLQRAEQNKEWHEGDRVGLLNRVLPKTADVGEELRLGPLRSYFYGADEATQADLLTRDDPDLAAALLTRSRILDRSISPSARQRLIDAERTLSDSVLRARAPAEFASWSGADEVVNQCLSGLRYSQAWIEDEARKVGWQPPDPIDAIAAGQAG